VPVAGSYCNVWKHQRALRVSLRAARTGCRRSCDHRRQLFCCFSLPSSAREMRDALEQKGGRADEDKLAGMCLLISRRLAHSDLCMACQATWGWRPAGGDAPQRMQVIRCARPRRVPVVPCPCALRCVAATKAGLGAFFVCRRERSDDAMCRFRLRTPQLRRQRVRHISSNCRVSVGTRERFASPCKTLMGDWEC